MSNALDDKLTCFAVQAKTEPFFVRMIFCRVGWMVRY